MCPYLHASGVSVDPRNAASTASLTGQIDPLRPLLAAIVGAVTTLGCLRLRTGMRRVYAARRRNLQDELEKKTAALAESEARFCSIVERTADGIVIVGEEGRIEFLNPAAERMFSRPSGELVGQDFGQPVVAGETTEMDIVRKAGNEPVVAELRVSATTWESAPAQLISLRDITDRKRAEEQAQRILVEQAARERAEAAARQSRLLAEVGAALDRSSRIEAALAEVARIIVAQAADLCVIDLLEGNTLRRAAAAHSDPRKEAIVHEELKPEHPTAAGSPEPAVVHVTDEESLHEDRDWNEASGVADNAHGGVLSRLGIRSKMSLPLYSPECGLGVMTLGSGSSDFDAADVAFGVEIASRVAHALEKARLYDAAIAASRAKSDFLAVVSHELRTPLNAITGYTDLLLAEVGGATSESQRSYLQRIKAGAMQLLHLIEQILTYAHADAGDSEVRSETVRIGELIDEIVAIAEPLALDKGLEFRRNVRQPDEAITTDAGKLRQVILNLLTNAVKFTGSGSVSLEVELNQSQLDITISDTGRGIAADDLERIFEPFQQLEQGATRRVGGMGLGLSICSQLARVLGGELEVESTPGRGSTFRARIPCARPYQERVNEDA